MANGFSMIDEATWKGFPPEQRDYVVYQYLYDIHRRVETLEHRKMVHAACATVGGFIGGFTALAVFIKGVLPYLTR